MKKNILTIESCTCGNTLHEDYDIDEVLGYHYTDDMKRLGIRKGDGRHVSGYRVSCECGRDSGVFPTRAQAVREWNTLTRELKEEIRQGVA